MANEVKNISRNPPVPQPSQVAPARPAPELDPKAAAAQRTVSDLVPRNLMNQLESYLVEKGWELAGVNEKGQTLWDDPIGKATRAPRQVPRVQLPVAGGGHEVVRQWVHPATNWTYPIDEAIKIQRLRDSQVESDARAKPVAAAV